MHGKLPCTLTVPLVSWHLFPFCPDSLCHLTPESTTQAQTTCKALIPEQPKGSCVYKSQCCARPKHAFLCPRLIVFESEGRIM